MVVNLELIPWYKKSPGEGGIWQGKARTMKAVHEGKTLSVEPHTASCIRRVDCQGVSVKILGAGRLVERDIRIILSFCRLIFLSFFLGSHGSSSYEVEIPTLLRTESNLQT